MKQEVVHVRRNGNLVGKFKTAMTAYKQFELPLDTHWAVRSDLIERGYGYAIIDGDVWGFTIYKEQVVVPKKKQYLHVVVAGGKRAKENSSSC